MKILINKTHEIEVDEKFRDMFPMKSGCEKMICSTCPFSATGNCSPFMDNFTAEIVEDKIDFNSLKIGQKVWKGSEELFISGKNILISERGEYKSVEFNDDGEWYEISSLQKMNLSLAPPPKKKVTKTVEAWVAVWEKGGGIISFHSTPPDTMANGSILVRLSGIYEIEE